jgi:hypothetical protein
MFKTLSMAAVLIGFALTLSAQASPYPDTFKVNYFSNANTEGCLEVPCVSPTWEPRPVQRPIRRATCAP